MKAYTVKLDRIAPPRNPNSVVSYPRRPYLGVSWTEIFRFHCEVLRGWSQWRVAALERQIDGGIE
jgi:hypothetical protein